MSQQNLSHINDKGEANMVDTSGKEATTRIATASGKVTIKADVLNAIASGQTPKGDVLSNCSYRGNYGRQEDQRTNSAMSPDCT
jgi:cyclic pyranopterin phosphate synthase